MRDRESTSTGRAEGEGQTDSQQGAQCEAGSQEPEIMTEPKPDV